VQTAVFRHVDEVAVRILDLRWARLGHADTELDVGTAAGHVRRDRDRAGLAGLRHDLRLALVVLGVEHVVRQATALKQLRQRL
jgi:hypothetical protein